MDNSVGTVSDLIGMYALNIALSIAIFVVGKWLANKLTAICVTLFNKTSKIDDTLTKFLKNIIYYVLMVIVVLTALKQLGVDTTSFFAILGAAGLAVGLALKDSLGNFASGLMIIMFRPFKVGDFINAAGNAGTVEEISIFNTILKTGDNQKLIIPNGSITAGTIVNVNANDTRRIDLVVGVSYDDDIKKAKTILEDILNTQEKVLLDKGITVGVVDLADSSVNFNVRAWVKTDDYWEIRYALLENIKIRLDEEGISIPFPQRDVHVYKEND